MKEYNIRPIKKSDSKAIWQIRNHKLVRPFMNIQDEIPWASHQQWFAKRFGKTSQPYLVLEKNKAVAGYIRFDKKNSKTFEIDIAINPRMKGRGLGTFLLKQSLAIVEPQLKNYNILVNVKRSNPASQKIFIKNNFKLVRSTKNHYYNIFIYPVNIVIATIKPWNLDYYQKYFGQQKNYYLIKDKKDLNYQNLKKINPRYVFFPHWSWIIPDQIWQDFECVVFHMTDLPYGRGGTPLQNLIARGHTKTKISSLKVEHGLDTGPIYFKTDLSLFGTAQEIYQRASQIIFKKMIPHIVKNSPQPKPQKGKVVNFARRKPAQGLIKDNMSLKEIYNLIRMLDAQTYPKAYLETNKLKIEFTQAQLKNKKLTAKVEIYAK